jgi:hypothetical protein
MIHRSMARLVATSACALALAMTAIPPGRAIAATAAQPSDFDGDGYADLAIGAPITRGKDSRSEVNVLYGSRTGLSAARDQVWSQATRGIKGTPDPLGDDFGQALASGDFDADGFADLAVGVPMDTVGGVRGVGAVNVLYGSPAGLTAARDQRWLPVGMVSASLSGFGEALAAGDFDADGHWDLAIGAPADDPRPSSGAGAVIILRGTGVGLTASDMQVLRDEQIASPDPFPIDVLRLGWSLVAGDFDGDGAADLAVGAPSSGDTALLPEIDAPGAVAVFYGSTDGLDTSSSELWHQDSPGIPDDDEANDEFGTSLAAGDVDGDGDDDLVVGAPSEYIGDSTEAGAVTVIPGSAAGLTATGSQQWHQEVAGVPGIGKSNDRFGVALAVGDFDRGGAEDLAIGVPGKDIGRTSAAGRVIVLLGSSIGLTVTGARAWTQASPGIPGKVQAVDLFGSSLTALDFGRSGRVDLAIGVPGQRVEGHSFAGMVNVLYGSQTGLTGNGAQGWSQASPGVKGVPASDEEFGASLAH